jgi:hypothetical protein
MSKRFGFPRRRGGIGVDGDFEQMREKSGASADPDFLYYNAMIINNSTDTTQKSPDPGISYQDTRSLPILNDKSKYAVSVENFSISGAGKDLPIFIPQIREYNTDGSLNQNPDNTVYDVTFTWRVGSQIYQSLRSVQWVPEDQAVWTEKPRSLAQNVAEGTYAYPQPEIPYYYCYTYTNWLNCINTALRLAWEDVKVAVTTGGTPVLTLTLARLTGGVPAPGDQFWLFDSETSNTALDVGIVYSFDGNTLKLVGTSPIVSWSPNYFVANDIGGVEPATIAAEITETSLVTSYDDPSAFGTKCPFFSYEPLTNLFSLYQDSNTSIVPYGQTIPGQLSVFGSSTDPSYSAGEFSTVGYNSNLEGLLTNFDTTYYSDQVPLGVGVSINSPVGTETPTQNLEVSGVATSIGAYADKVLTTDLTGLSNNLASANWKFDEIPLISPSVFDNTSTSPFLFELVNGSIPDYYEVGLAVTATDSSGAVVQGIITLITAGPIEFEITGVGSFGPDIYNNWTIALVPLTSNTPVTASVGTKLTLNTNLDYTESPLFTSGLSVTTSAFDATVNSFGEGLAYENVQGGSTVFSSTTGILSVDKTYLDSGNSEFKFSGPFVVGDTVTDPTSGGSAVIESISGDNGYTTLTFSQQKNPFAIGHEVESFISLADTTNTICSGVIVDIIGDNTGYGTVNITNQNGKFGIGEIIVNNFNDSIATIVGIEGTNNGYATVAYINQTTTGAPGSFIPGEFLLSEGLAFAQVVLDNQNVLNQTEGNIGNVTCITGIEVAGIFTPTSNIPLPSPGQQIQGTQSGTIADYGGVSYLESATLTVSNIAGSFNVGDLIVDNVGYGLASANTTISVTATCNGFAYLGGGQLILKNTKGGASAPATFNTSNLLIDFDSSSEGTATNTTAITVSNITEFTQFLNGDPVTSSGGATGKVVLNCGPVPYGSPDTTTQLLTILPDPGSVSFQPGETLTDSNVGATLTIDTDVPNDYYGSFSIGDQVAQNNISDVTLTSFTPPQSTFTLGASVTLAAGTIVTGNTSDAVGTIVNGSGSSYVVGSIVGTFVKTETIYWFTADTQGTLTSYTDPTTTFTLEESATIPIGSVVTGTVTGSEGTVTGGGGTSYNVTITLGVFDDREEIYWETPATTATLASPNGVNPVSTFVLASSQTIASGTVLTGSSSTATGVVYDGSGTSYVVYITSGTFTNGETITWTGGGTVTLTNSTLVATSKVLVFTAFKTSLSAGNTIYDLTSNARATVVSGFGTTYLIGQIIGTFTNGDALVWYTSSTVANLSSYTTPRTTFTLASAKTIPPGTKIQGTVTDAVAQVVSGGGTSYVVSLLSGSFDEPEAIDWVIAGTTSQTLADYTPIQSTLTLGASRTIEPNNTVTGQLSNASGTIVSGSGTSYVIKNIFGTFQNGETIQWNSDFATISSYTTQGLNIRIVLTNPNVIPIGITITGSVSGAKGEILSEFGSGNTSYNVGNIIGQFLDDENITWIITGNIVYIPTPNSFHLINTSGTFTNGGQLINTRKQIYCDMRPVYYYASGPGTVGTWRAPFVGESIFDWNTLCNGTVSYVYYNPAVTNATFYVNQESVNGKINNGDSIGIMPFLEHSSGSISPAGANITLNGNTANWRVGETIYFANTHDNEAWSAIGTVSSINRGATVGTFIMDVAFNAFEQRSGVWSPGINGANYASRGGIRTSPSDKMTKINYYTNGGQLVSPALSNQNAFTTILNAQAGSSTIGTIANVNTSPSSAFIQTSKPPANDTTLTLQGVSGVFGTDNLIESSGSFGNVADYTATNATSTFTSFAVGNTVSQGGVSGTITALTPSTMTIESIMGSFTSGAITNDTTNATADITLVEGSLTMTPYKVRQSSGSNWTILPTPLTSSTYVSPVYGTETFNMNLTLAQSLLKINDPFLVSQSDSLLTVKQLYYPENVVQVNPSKILNTILLGQPFPSGTPASLPYYTHVTQDYESTSSLWSPVQSIVIGTTFITVREEYSGTPITIGTGNLGSNATTASFQKVLLETPLQLLPQNGWRGQLFYEPKTETLSSLGLSKEELKNLDFQIYWRNRLTNTLTPLQLYNGGSASVRLLFKKIHE